MGEIASSPRYARRTEGAQMARQLNEQGDDGLSTLLQAIDVRSAVYCVSELSAPWGFRVDGSSVPKFHLVLEGACILTLNAEESLALECGDLVLLPGGSGHVMRDQQGSAVRHLDRILADFRTDVDGPLIYGGDGPPTRLLCGGFVLSESIPRHLLALLPSVLRLDMATSGLNRWMEPVFELLCAETEGQRPGRSAVLAKLADGFLTQALRTYLAGAEAAGLLRADALADPSVGQAVELLHAQPERRWTVEHVARQVGMSRTHFSERFRSVVGESPMRYLARVRLGRAAGLLTTSRLTVYTIAQSTGYESEASLSKAFKRVFAQSPGEYRRDRARSPIRIAEVNAAEQVGHAVTAAKNGWGWPVSA